MTDTGPPPNVNALVEALEARARQAGSEGAMTLLRGMLGTVAETMSSIEERLGRIEANADDQSGEMALAEAVQSALTSFNAWLGRLEEAFVQAVEESGSGTQQIVDQIREAVVASLPPPPPDAPAARPQPVPPPPPPPSAAEVAGEVVGGMRRLLETHTSALGQRFNAVDQRLGALERLEDTVQQLRDRPPPEPLPATSSFSPPEPTAPALDPELVDRLEAAIAALDRDEASARTVALLEERIAAVVKVIGERTEEVRDAIRQEFEAMPRPAPPPPPDLSALARIEEQLRRLADRPAPEPPDTSVLARIEEEVRRLADRPLPEPPPAPEAPDMSVLARIEEEVRRLADRPAPEPPDTSVLARIEEEVRRLADRPLPEPPPAPEPPDLSALVRIEGELRRLADRPVPELSPPLPSVTPPPIEIPVYELSDIVRRESELLTQRVAALAVGVEATRALLEQLVADMEQSLGHKATEVGRRLAADLGLRSRRTTRRRDRELGPGA